MADVPISETVAFWSYAHADSASDGRLLQLAEDIRAEYALVSGQELEVFVDREKIEWGQAWRARIGTALATAAFFIPIITPRYFNRPECRNELIAFTSEAGARGLSHLLLPILYVPVEGLAEDSLDDAMALIGKTQWVDWTGLRLADRNSTDYRLGVNAMAKRLKTALAEVNRDKFEEEVRALDDPSLDTGLADILSELEARLPGWLDAVIGDQSGLAAFKAIGATHLARYGRLKKAKSPPGAQFAMIQRFAQEALPICERHYKDAQEYARLCLEMDPLVIQALALTEAHPENRPSLADLRIAISEAMQTIRPGMTFEAPDETGKLVGLDKFRHISRLAATADELLSKANSYVDEGNQIVQRWDQRLSALDASVSEAEGPD